MILVATKSDMNNDRKVTFAQGKDLAAKYDIDFIETSAKEDINVN
jgi:GTPase KRas protein